jgi:hypothetical protein
VEKPVYMERALFVVGQPGGGKSAHLKNMFLDWRFHTSGVLWKKTGPIPPVALSNERTLRIFSQSAQEGGHSIQQWIDRIKESIGPGRWCFGGALQAKGAKKLPEALPYVEAFIEAFSPERVRICFLSPDKSDRTIDQFLDLEEVIPAILSMDGVECVFIDAKLLNTNALMMADFFDFI